MGLMGWVLVLVLAVAPAPACAGAAFAGMGGVGCGIADTSGDFSDNPAAVAATGVDRGWGIVHLSGGFSRLTFAGSVYNIGVKTTGSFPAASGLSWSVVTPDLNEGRVGIGIWQVDSHVFDLSEPLNLSLPMTSGGPALSDTYEAGQARVIQDEALYAAGGVWIQPLGDGNQQIAAGALYLNQTGRGRLQVTANRKDTGDADPLRNMMMHRSLNGFGMMAGYFYRPLPDGSLGVSLTYLGSLAGHIWQQEAGGPLFSDHDQHPSQMRISIGGSFKVTTGLIVAVDMRYAGEVKGSATLFGGTSAAAAVNEVTDPTFAIHAGAEYRLPLFLGEMPLRIGYFNRPDPLPATTVSAGMTPVAGFGLPSVKQDVMGITIGTGLTRMSASIDLGLQWLLVNTHTKLLLPGASAPVDSGDVRSSYGAVASFTLRFGPKAGD